MEFVFRGKEKDGHDLFIEPGKDGSLRIDVRSKNETGHYVFNMTAEEFDILCKVRELSIINRRTDNGSIHSKTAERPSVPILDGD